MQLYVFPTATTIDCRRRRRRFDEPTDHSFLFTFNGIEPLAIVSLWQNVLRTSAFLYFPFFFLLSLISKDGYEHSRQYKKIVRK